MSLPAWSDIDGAEFWRFETNGNLSITRKNERVPPVGFIGRVTYSLYAFVFYGQTQLCIISKC